MDDKEKLIELRDKPRSERLETLCDFGAFDYQEELLNKSAKVVKAAVKPGRQVGKTVTGGAIAADEGIRGSDVMILAPYEDTGAEMMEAFRNHVSRAEERLSGTGFNVGVETRNKTEWTFSNGGRVRMRTVGTDGTQIRGKNPNVVLVDEAAYIKDSIFTEVIEPFFSTHENYQFYLFSTPAGKSGYFYEKVVQDDDWYSPHWPSEISPLITSEFLQDKKEQLDSITFAQEYLGEFVDEGDAFLPFDTVQPCIGEPELSGKVWLGVDVARKGKDRTVYTARDENKNVEILAAEDTSTIPGIIGRIKQLHQEYTFEKVLVDENAVGGGVVDDEELNAMGIIQGVKFTTKSKHEMYNRLKTDFESQSLCIPQHRKLIDELTSLQFSVTQNGYYKVKHPDGGHDDFADSLALANWGESNMVSVTYRNGNRSRKGSIR